MARPNIPGLEAFLATLSFEPPANRTDFDSEVISSGMWAGGVDQNRQPIAEIIPEMKLWHQKNIDGFTIDSLLSIVESYLKRRRHPSNKQIALAAIGLYLILRPSRQTYAEFFYEVLETTIESSATLFYVFPEFRY